jgi:capsid protein
MLDRLRATFATARERGAAMLDAVRGAGPGVPTIEYSALGEFGFDQRFQNGSKFEGGFGQTKLLVADYWTLRMRSKQLFEENLYARGLIRRLVTNEIATGLHLESTPVESLLGRAEDSLADWAEDVETRFSLWQSDPWLCDYGELRTFGALQIQARMQALVEGDVLVVLRQFSSTQLPRVQLISGSAVRSPTMGRVQLAQGNRIVEGVELDAQNRQVAYWVTQRDGTSKRLPAAGPKSGRRLAWLVYGTDRQLDDVRGKPLLTLVLQSLREIDRYRDSVQRKAVVNSMLAMFVQKDAPAPGSRPAMRGAVRKGSIDDRVDGNVGDAPRRFNVAELIPGMVIDELNVGEKPVGFPSNGIDEKFGAFEEAIIQAVAWANEIPPEILRLSFSSNYSASQAAINELKLYLNKVRADFGDMFCTPIFVEWIVAMALVNKVQAPELVDAWRDPKKYDVFAAWTSCDWSGAIKLNVDLGKLTAGYDLLLANGGITHDRMSREITGTKFSQNVKKLRLENEALVRALEPLQKLDPKFLPAAQPDNSSDSQDDKTAERGQLVLLTRN